MKGYITIEYEGTERVDVEDVLCEVSDDVLKQEAAERGLIKDDESVCDTPFFDNHKDNNRRRMCELLGLNYHTSKEEIINELKARL